MSVVMVYSSNISFTQCLALVNKIKAIQIIIYLNL